MVEFNSSHPDIVEKHAAAAERQRNLTVLMWIAAAFVVALTLVWFTVPDLDYDNPEVMFVSGILTTGSAALVAIAYAHVYHYYDKFTPYLRWRRMQK